MLKSVVQALIMSRTVSPPPGPAPKIGKGSSAETEAAFYESVRGPIREKDILKQPPPTSPPKLTRLKIGIHTSTSGGVDKAAERAYRLGCNTLQIFSSSPRQWAQSQLGQPQCDEMKRLREQYDLKPLAIHTNYLVNMASITESFLKKSIEAFRGEIER